MVDYVSIRGPRLRLQYSSSKKARSESLVLINDVSLDNGVTIIRELGFVVMDTVYTVNLDNITQLDNTGIYYMTNLISNFVTSIID